MLPTKHAYVPGRPPAPRRRLRPAGRRAARRAATAAGGNVRTIDMATGSAVTTRGSGRHGALRRPAPDAKDVEIWLPHNEITELVALRTDAPVEPAPDRGRRVWLHHGSSISHGSNAESPTTTWPALAAAARRRGAGQPGVRRQRAARPVHRPAMRDTPADLISVKIGINLVNTDLMRLRAFAPGGARLPRHRSARATRPRRCWSSRRSCARSTRTPPARPRRTSAALAEGRLSFRATGDPADRDPADADDDPRRARAASAPSGRPTTRTCTTSTAASCTARRTPPSCRCPTSSTPTPPPTGASASGSRSGPSATADPSPAVARTGGSGPREAAPSPWPRRTR